MLFKFKISACCSSIEISLKQKLIIGALSLLGKVFQRYLSVRQLVTHGKTVKIAKPVLKKIFNKQFRAPTIYRQVLIFVDKFCWFFFHHLQIGVLKNICSKNLIQRNCNRNSRSVNYPCECEFFLKKTYNKWEAVRTCVFLGVCSQIKKQILYRTYVLQNSQTSRKEKFHKQPLAELFFSRSL